MRTSFMGSPDSIHIVSSRLCAIEKSYYYVHIFRPYSGVSMELWHLLATSDSIEITKKSIQGIGLKIIDPHGIRIVDAHKSIVLSLFSAESDSLQLYLLKTETATAMPIALRGPKVSPRINYSLLHLGCQRIFLVGGSSPAGVYQTSIFILDLTKAESIKLPPLSYGRDGFVLVHMNYDRVGLFGGHSKMQHDNLIYSINQCQWTASCTFTEMDNLLARRWKPCVYKLTDTILLIFGGYNGRVLNDLYAYSISSNVYIAVYPKETSMLMPREDGAFLLTKDGANLVILGGGVQKCDVLYLEQLQSNLMVTLSKILLQRDSTQQQSDLSRLSSAKKDVDSEKKTQQSKIVEEIKARISSRSQEIEILELPWSLKK